MTQPKR